MSVNTIDVELPFIGFYISRLSVSDDVFEDEETGEYNNDVWDRFDNEKYELAVCKAYVTSLTDMLPAIDNLDKIVTYAEMTHPQYYNYESDRLFASVSVDYLKALFEKYKNTETYRNLVKEATTSTLGYMPFHNYEDYMSAEWVFNVELPKTGGVSRDLNACRRRLLILASLIENSKYGVGYEDVLICDTLRQVDPYEYIKDDKVLVLV